MVVRLFLGFDLSTQQLKALVIDQDLNVVTEASVHFDNDLPEFKTQGGVHKHEDSLTVTVPTLIWVRAFDLVLQRLKEKGLKFESVACLSGTGQQHGSIYWKKGAQQTLRNLQGGRSLFEQLEVSYHHMICNCRGILQEFSKDHRPSESFFIRQAIRICAFSSRFAQCFFFSTC